jgi:FAD:protein FMN transferase
MSVAAATCADANTASTAAIIRGEAALAWLDGLRLPARLVAESGAVVTLGAWPPDQPSAPPEPASPGERPPGTPLAYGPVPPSPGRGPVGLRPGAQ